MITSRSHPWSSMVAWLALALALLPGTTGANCAGEKGMPKGKLPPGYSQPFQPPPEGPQEGPEQPQGPEQPEEPTEPPPGGTVDPNRPGGLAPPSGGGTPPGGPTTPPVGVGPGGARARPARGLDALDDDAWEIWWAFNRSDVLPRVRRQADSPDGAYGRTLPAQLRPAFDAILEALEDGEPTVRAAAAGALAGFVTDYRRADTIAALRRGAQGAALWHRSLCHLGLGLRGDLESAESMRKVLRSKHEVPVARAFAALGLIHLGTPEGMVEVEKAAEDLDEADVAGCVLIGLGQTRDPKHLPRLMEAAKRRGGSAMRLRRVRADAITALGKHGDPSSIELLGDLLEDKEKVIARAAALALGGFKGSEPAAVLLRKQGLASEDPFVRAFAVLGLGRIGNLSSIPAIAGRVQAEEEVGVRPFLMLGAGLTRDAGALVLLEEALQESPRSGRFSAAALSAGLLSAQDDGRARLRASLTDTRKPSAPACSALGLGLLSDKATVPHLRKAFWFDSTRVRPSFDDALSLLGAEDQSAWLLSEYKLARRSSARQALAGALAKCGGPAEGAAMVELYRAAPHGDAALRISLLTAMAVIINDRVVSQPRSLLLHTYYLQPNDVLGHIMFLP